MIGVEIPLLRWQELFSHSTRRGDQCILYELDNGLVISSESLSMPWEHSSDGVIVEFEIEKDATWFILSYGGVTE